MTRHLAILLMLLVFNAAACAQDAANEPEEKELATKKAATPAEDLLTDADNVEALHRYLQESIRYIQAHVRTAPEAAREKTNEMETLLGKLEPTTDEAEEAIQEARTNVAAMKRQLELNQKSAEELAAELKENPNDQEILRVLVSKVVNDVRSIARTDPDAAAKKLEVVQKAIEELPEDAVDENQEMLRAVAMLLAPLEGAIEAGRKLNELIGKEAAPLEVDAWVNGEPLTGKELEGKIVLLDFWAVWCRPCIATFPHLRQWHEQYSDQGLVIVGLTNYQNYKWDEEAKRAVRSREEVTHEQEQEMLEKFADEYELQHRFGVSENRELSEYYGVTGIPHVVLIDREGKIRLIRVGSGEQNAKEVEEMIQKLL